MFESHWGVDACITATAFDCLLPCTSSHTKSGNRTANPANRRKCPTTSTYQFEIVSNHNLGSARYRLCSPCLVWQTCRVSTKTPRHDVGGRSFRVNGTRRYELENGYVDRLTAVKQVLTRFIAQRKGDRLGLVLFADHAYLQTPLTLDRTTVLQQLNRAQLNMIGSQTAIGEGLGIATKTFIKSNTKQRVIVLLSDGSNTSGVIEPLRSRQNCQR